MISDLTQFEEKNSRSNSSYGSDISSDSSLHIIDRTSIGCGYTRDSVKNGNSSPILCDPEFLPRPSADPMTPREISTLKKLKVCVTDQTPPNEGSFACIYRATLETKRAKVEIAVKRSIALRQSWAELEALKLFGREKSHKNIIKFYGNKVIGCRMYLFIELTPSGDLTNYLSVKYQERDPTEEEIFTIFRQVLDGVHHMHYNGYAHRDLKLNNILVFESDRVSRYHNEMVYKICDFGTSRGDLRLINDSIKLLTTVIGSPKLMAPEMSDSVPYNAFISDTYSLGVILYQLSHSGEFPFELSQSFPQNDRHRRQEILQLAALKRKPETIPFRSSLSNELKQLLQKMLDPDPKRRSDLNGVYPSEWMRINVNMRKNR